MALTGLKMFPHIIILAYKQQCCDFCFSIIQECLAVWARSPRAYTQLRQSKLLILPSEKLLIKYKNSVDQTVGYNKHNLQWMVSEATRANLPAHGYWGGLMFDEMSIQVKSIASVITFSVYLMLCPYHMPFQVTNNTY
jgi:hypothetical protein